MSTGTRFIAGSVGTFVILILISIVYFNLPIESTLVMSYLVISGLVGLLLALRSRVHSGHTVLVIGLAILIASSVIVSGGIDLIIGGEIKQKLWDIPFYMFTQLIIVMGVGLLMIFIGLHITWRRR